MLAYDMADRIRANRVGAFSGDYDSDSSFSANSESCMGANNACLPANMADFDKLTWYNAVNALPGGSGSVVDNGDESFTVTVRWDDARTGVTGTNCPPLSEADLRCFTVNVAL